MLKQGKNYLNCGIYEHLTVNWFIFLQSTLNSDVVTCVTRLSLVENVIFQVECKVECT